MLSIVGAMAFIPDQRAPLVFGVLSAVGMLIGYRIRRLWGAAPPGHS
jgi:GABA permease